MNCDRGFLHSSAFGRCLSFVGDPRGARQWHIFVATDLYTVGSFDPDHDAVMRIGGEAPGGGPILSVGIGAMSAAGSRHLGSSISAVRRKVSASTQQVGGCSSRAFNLPDAG